MTWYALNTGRQLERRAFQVLRAEGFDPFLPIEVRVLRPDRRAGKRRSIRLPLIPGYVFAREIPWRLFHTAQFNGRRLLLGVLGPDGPEPIPDEQMAAIRSVDGTTTPLARIKPGDVLTIRLGYHDRRQVTVTDVMHGRLQVAMLMLGGYRLMTVDESKIEAA